MPYIQAYKASHRTVGHRSNLIALELDAFEVIGNIVVILVYHTVNDAPTCGSISPGKPAGIVIQTVPYLPRPNLARCKVSIP